MSLVLGLLLLWGGFMLGFFLASVLSAARDDDLIREHNDEAVRSARGEE